MLNKPCIFSAAFVITEISSTENLVTRAALDLESILAHLNAVINLVKRDVCHTIAAHYGVHYF